MAAWLLRRLVISVPVLLGITILTFTFVRLAPGDPVAMMFPPEALASGAQDLIARTRAELGLDQPLPIQYLAWLRQVLMGNLGYSYFDHRPVGDILKERIGPTAELMGSALLIGLVVGVPLGTLAALRQDSWVDYLATILSLATISTPSFFLGLTAIFVFSLRLDWLPTSGMFTAGSTPDLLDELRHLVLPACILGLTQAGPFMRYTRASMLDVVRQDYLQTARAKGLAAGVVTTRHALPNALIPLISVIGVQIPLLMSGAVVTEAIFSWPGMGQLALAAITQRDYPVLMGFTMTIAVLVLVCNLLADLGYTVVDPRIRPT